LALLLLGWLFATVLRKVCRTAVASALGRLGPKMAGRGVAALAGWGDSAPRVLAALVYWIVWAFFAAAAMEQLSLPVVTDLLHSLAMYLPKVLLAVLIVFVGLALGGLANQWIASAGTTANIAHATALGRVAQGGVLLVALMTGAHQVGIESDLVVTVLTVTLAATLGAMALAFGLGSGPIVSNILASYYAAKSLRVGDRVQIGGVEGVLVEIGPTTLVLEAVEGRLHMPARKYCEEVTVLVEGER
jgi:small-conductance mechanosensitive channel